MGPFRAWRSVRPLN